MADAPAPLSGKLLLHYRVGRRLGGGGMGEVYLAEDTRLGRQVALKFLPAAAQADDMSRARLVREAQAASLLRSPNIATTYDLVEQGDDIFIAMEYVEGELLSERIARGTLPIRQAADIAAQVADALDEAHGLNIVHRDIKSSNLMLARRGLVKVLDFGLAKFEPVARPPLDLTAIHVTSPGIVMGTVAYMAPEQLLGGPTDHRADLFSLGVVLYEMVSGRLPFQGSTLAETFDRILHQEPDAIARLNYGAPPELEAVLRKALEKDPRFRYQSARDLHIDLHHLARRLEAVETSGATRPPAQAAPSTAEPVRVEAGERWIAVLTFANITREPGDEWIGTGIAETVTADLKNVHGLAVISRTQIYELLTALASGRTTADDQLAIEVGRRLGAWWIVAGAYQRLGGRIRITAHVLEVLTGALIKTLKVDGRVEDIFELQDQIVFELSRGLNLRVDRSEAAAIVRDETKSVEAFEAFSRGVVNLRMAGRDSIDRAIAMFERAVALDPAYASAWASLGGAYQLKGSFLGVPELTHKALDPLRKALLLKPDITQAHTWLGSALLVLGRADEAADALREALRLEPENPNVHQGLARVLWMGHARVPEAIHHLRQAITINPEAGYAYLQLSLLEALNGDLDAAEASAREAVALQERALSGTEGLLIVGARARLGYVHYLRGRYDAAYDEYRRELEFLGSTEHALRDRTTIELHQKLSALHAARGERDAAARFGELAIQGLDRRLAAGADDPATRYYGAAVFAGRGDVGNTLKHLTLPFQRLARFTAWRLERDPDFEPVRRQPAFVERVAAAR